MKNLDNKVPEFFLSTSEFFVPTSQKGENLPKGLFVFSTPDQTLFKKYVQENLKSKYMQLGLD